MKTLISAIGVALVIAAYVLGLEYPTTKELLLARATGDLGSSVPYYRSDDLQNIWYGIYAMGTVGVLMVIGGIFMFL